LRGPLRENRITNRRQINDGERQKDILFHNFLAVFPSARMIEFSVNLNQASLHDNTKAAPH
jgi:hypothetical protein